MCEKEGVVQVSLGTLTQEFECGDIFVHISFLHSQLLEFFLCTDVLGIVDECVLEPSFEDLPSILSRRDKPWDFVHTVKPVVHLLNPSLDFGSIDQQQKVGTTGHWVACNASTSIHEHESLELSQELVSFVPVSSEAIRGVSFKASIALGPFFFFVKISHCEWVVSHSVWTARGMSASGCVGRECYCIVASALWHFFVGFRVCSFFLVKVWCLGRILGGHEHGNSVSSHN